MVETLCGETVSASQVSAMTATLDASLGGIGGCPFAPKATRNVPSEDVAYLFGRSGVGTGLDLGKLVQTAPWVSENTATVLV